MPVDFSVLRNRAIPNVGKVFESGHYVKSPFLCPNNSYLAANLKALIYQEQNKVFGEVEARDGFTFQKEGANYFNEKSINICVHRDPNRLAIWIDMEDKQIDQTDKPRKLIATNIYATPGKGDPETQIVRANGYLLGISNLISATPPEFLVVGWPVNIETAKSNYQPEVKILANFISKPDSSEGDLSNNVPLIPVLRLEIELKPKHNTLPAIV